MKKLLKNIRGYLEQVLGKFMNILKIVFGNSKQFFSGNSAKNLRIF